MASSTVSNSFCSDRFWIKRPTVARMQCSPIIYSKNRRFSISLYYLLWKAHWHTWKCKCKCKCLKVPNSKFQRAHPSAFAFFYPLPRQWCPQWRKPSFGSCSSKAESNSLSFFGIKIKTKLTEAAMYLYVNVK